jgi:hypothetical protein
MRAALRLTGRQLANCPKIVTMIHGNRMGIIVARHGNAITFEYLQFEDPFWVPGRKTLVFKSEKLANEFASWADNAFHTFMPPQHSIFSDDARIFVTAEKKFKD